MASLHNQGCSAMRRKHWHGYGTVNVFVKVRNKLFIQIKVTGDHEQGLEVNPGDTYTLAQWLGKQGKFTKEEVQSFDIDCTYSNTETNHCMYTIYLKPAHK